MVLASVVLEFAGSVSAHDAPLAPEAEKPSAEKASQLPQAELARLTDDVIARIAVDKKRIGANLRFITIREVGACEPVDIALTELRRFLRTGAGS